MRIFLSLIAFLILLVFGAYQVLFNLNAGTPDQTYNLDIEGLRTLAKSEGTLPVSMDRELVADADWPRKAALAGDTWDTVVFEFSAFMVNYADGSHVLVDTVLDKGIRDSLATTSPVRFHDESYTRLSKAMTSAKAIVLTHEHMDHIGGLAAEPDALDRTHLSPEQKSHPEKMLPAVFPEGTLEAAQTYEYERTHLVAPGVVALKAPGHSPGSQIVYVQLQNGTEFLFVGDIVWNMDGITKQTSRPLLVSRVFLEEDRDAVAAQIIALQNLTRSHPDVRIVVAHDHEQIKSYVEQGLVGEKFPE